MTPDRVGVVVVNFSSHQLVGENLAALEASGGDDPDLLAVVVDNFSTAGEREAARRLCRDRGWEFVAAPGNPGFGGGADLGARRALQAGCDVVVLLNPDARLDRSGVLRLAALCRGDHDLLVAPLVQRPDGSVWSAGSRIDLATGRVGRAPQPFVSGPDRWLSGACLAIHRSGWQQLDGFGSGWFLYWEDVDLSRRWVDLGGTLLLADDVTAVHDAGGTQEHAGTRRKSGLYYHYNCRNRLLWGARHLGTPALLRWVLRTPAESAAVLLRGGRRQILASPSVLWSTLTGTTRGLGIAVAELARRGVRTVLRRPAAPPAGGAGSGTRMRRTEEAAR
ncbi:glycosyltransferase family 2 protein [Nakamurella alba]|uniref:glycosyltransferase family 2 protein n=1 Tax=Nakamurella alba TaxID=2665158 RepID=UPI0018AB5FA7|nr:glycosyltransferase family 2 protein [Nakamurella alba]